MNPLNPLVGFTYEKYPSDIGTAFVHRFKKVDLSTIADIKVGDTIEIIEERYSSLKKGEHAVVKEIDYFGDIPDESDEDGEDLVYYQFLEKIYTGCLREFKKVIFPPKNKETPISVPANFNEIVNGPLLDVGNILECTEEKSHGLLEKGGSSAFSFRFKKVKSPHVKEDPFKNQIILMQLIIGLHIGVMFAMIVSYILETLR